MDVIEPSEILTGESRRQGVKPAHVNPWLRLAARFFDYALFFTLLRFAIGTPAALPPFEHWIPIEYFAWIPIEAVLLWSWGTTPGKWLLKTKLTPAEKKFSFEKALRRSATVWFKGLGMAIPFLNFFFMLLSYQQLRLHCAASWDRSEKTVITHEPVPPWRFYSVSALAIIGMIFYSYWKKGI